MTPLKSPVSESVKIKYNSRKNTLSLDGTKLYIDNENNEKASIANSSGNEN
jgi:hypothetical protein